MYSVVGGDIIEFPAGIVFNAVMVALTGAAHTHNSADAFR